LSASSIASIFCRKKTTNDRLESALVPTDRRTSAASKRSKRKFFNVSSNEDQARLIAERVARRIAGEASTQRPAPVESSIESAPQQIRPSRARMIDFVSPNPPALTSPRIATATTNNWEETTSPGSQFTPPTQSPWLAPFSQAMGEPFGQTTNSQFAIRNPQLIDHPSQERFGIEEATVSELVEFFENEKKCAVDPSGKPCDHCAMCSSRGF
jgi:hypothetical protein